MKSFIATVTPAPANATTVARLLGIPKITSRINTIPTACTANSVMVGKGGGGAPPQMREEALQRIVRDSIPAERSANPEHVQEDSMQKRLLPGADELDPVAVHGSQLLLDEPSCPDSIGPCLPSGRSIASVGFSPAGAELPARMGSFPAPRDSDAWPKVGRTVRASVRAWISS